MRELPRAEPRRRVLAYLQGILSDISRKNGWHLAEHAREARPDGMQRLLSHAVWDTNGVRDDLRAYALEQLGTESAILVIDETSLYVRYHQHSLSQRRLARSDTPLLTSRAVSSSDTTIEHHLSSWRKL